MTEAGSAYLNLLNTAARWVGVHARQEESRPTHCTLIQQVYTLLDVATPAARRAVKRSMLALTSERLVQNLEAMAQQIGGEVALAARDATKTLMSAPQHTKLLGAFNVQLAQLGYPPLNAPLLSPTQRTLGALFMDLIAHQRGDDKLEQVAWISIQGHQGAAALSLLAINLKPSERVALSFMMLRGLAQMHQARLEPEEGLAPERMLINGRFEVLSFPTERTQIKTLKSPEQRARLAMDKHSDVWTLAQLLDQLYQGRDLARKLSGSLDVPDEVEAVLVRGLSRRPKDRFHSGRELRVVLEKPLLTWRDRLLHEDHQSTGLIEPSFTFDMLTEQRNREMEQRIKERRQQEVKARRRMQWRAARRQLLWILAFLITVFAGLWSWLDRKQARLGMAYEQRSAFDSRDQKFNPRQEHQYAHRQVRWRYVEVFGARPALVSVAPVTAAQYFHCVEEGSCSALASERPRGCVSRPTQQPINCIAPVQALEFARFVNGELLEVDVWRWLVFGASQSRLYPWGDEKVTSQHAVLKWNNLPKFNTDEPVEVCTLPLGDSKDGLCDLVGNVKEWTLLPEVAKRLSEARAKNQAQPTIVSQDTFGVVGADWKTRANALRLNAVVSAQSRAFSETVGFRVIRWLDQPSTKGAPKPEAPADDAKIAHTEMSTDTPSATSKNPLHDPEETPTPVPTEDTSPKNEERGDD